MRYKLAIQLFLVLFALHCRADTNTLQNAILSFPPISVADYRPDQAVLSVNTLITAGQESACYALKEMAKPKQGPWDDELNEKICLLCRLLFVPSANRPPVKPPYTEEPSLRAPYLGAPELLPWNSINDVDWPYMPFAIVQNVPLSMTVGYSSEGVPETATEYINYCLANGTFRTNLFPIPTPITASNALQHLLTSQTWKTLKWKDSGEGWSYTLSEDYAKEALWQQVKNMTNKTVQATISSFVPVTSHP